MSGAASISTAIAVKAEEAYSQHEDFTQFIAANLDFHDLIARGCGNRRLARVISDLRNQIERLVYVIYEHYGPFDDHRDILRAIEARDVAAVSAIMTRHIETYKDRSLQAWPANGWRDGGEWSVGESSPSSNS